MKIFISSLITGMESLRTAAKEAVTQLGHDPIMAEDFFARPNSPQVACLEGLRKSGLVILILGEEYGATQSAGLSATHEEYREAKSKIPVIAFVQEGVQHKNEQAAFVKEVQGWEGGLFRGGFDIPENLKKKITRAIHEWQVSTATSPLNSNEIEKLAIEEVKREQGEHSRHSSLIFAITGGPVQSILRPSQIEKRELGDEMLQGALFGSQKIFSTASGTTRRIDADCLVLDQDERSNMIRLDPQGGLVFRLKLPESKNGMVIIQDMLEELIISSISYSAWLLDKIDPTQRLSHIALAMTFSENNLLIRTQAEDDASPDRFQIGNYYGRKNIKPIILKPSHRPRASLQHDAQNLAEDFVTLLKRAMSNPD